MPDGKKMNRKQLVALLTESQVPTFIMLVGAPGSGKTTLAEALEAAGLSCLSLDRMVAKDPWMMSMLEMLEGEFSKQLEAAMALHHPIVDDNLNINRANRKKLAKRLKAGGYRVIHVHLDAPVDVCLRQNRMRTQCVPDARLRLLWEELEKHGRPDAREGEVYRLIPIAAENSYEVEHEVERLQLPAQPWWRRWWNALWSA